MYHEILTPILIFIKIKMVLKLNFMTHSCHYFRNFRDTAMKVVLFFDVNIEHHTIYIASTLKRMCNHHNNKVRYLIHVISMKG